MSEHTNPKVTADLEDLDADDLATLQAGDDDDVAHPLVDGDVEDGDLLDEDDDLDDDEDDLDDDDLDDDDEDDDDLDDDEDDDEDDDDDEDEDEDDLIDAADDEVDLVVALYREEGQPVALALPKPLANDLDALIAQLRRLPADAGAVGMVSVAGEFFVIVRVRGTSVQLLISDAVSANDWPIARDVVEQLGVETPDVDDDSEPAGDLSLLTDQGLSDFDLEGYASNLDEDSDQLLAQVADRIMFGEQFRRAVASPTR